MIRIGIIGTGLIAREHGLAISLLPGRANIVAAADVDVQRLEAFCSSFQVRRRYREANKLIADPEVDVVVITTPPAAHEVVAVSALESGKYVFCEKPLAHSIASATRIAEASLRYQGRLAVSH